MNKQQAFDTVYKHYILDAKPLSLHVRMTHDGKKRTCKYRHKNGAKCPGGLLMHKSEYKTGFENQNFLQVCPPRLKPIKGFILEMIYIHDRIALWSTLSEAESRDKMGRMFCALAHKHKLNV